MTQHDVVQVQRKMADRIVERAAEMMLEFGVPVETIIDRLCTYVVAQMVCNTGKAHTVKVLDEIVEQVLNGAFDRVRKGSVN